MPDLPGFLRTVSGSGIGYLLAAICVLGLLVLRQLTHDAALRRRALIGVFLFLLFAIIRVPVTLTSKEAAAGNPFYQIVHIASLIILALALIQGLMLLLVEFLLVGRLKMEIPRILSDVALIAFFIVSVLVILYYETDVDLTGIFTTAGVLSIVIGLALQDTLGNVFAGLALQMERPYKVGDWISFGLFEGVVTDVSWRSTQFRTRTNDLVTVPNSTISKESFINHNAPSPVSGRLIHIGVSYHHPPAEVKRVLLAACKEVAGILDRPQPLCRLHSFDAYSVNYQVKFWLKDWAAALDIDEAYRTVVWYAFRREGIEIPFPIQVEYQHEYRDEETVEKQAAVAAADRVFQRLRAVELLAPLSDEELRTLARSTKVHAYYTDETICRQGDEGDSFFLIDEGTVVIIVSKNGRQEEVARLGPPEVFGEMAPLTGERRSATVRAAGPVELLVIGGEAFKSIIVANPDLATSLSQIIARRRVELGEKRDALDRSLAAAQDETSRQILARIRNFFGFPTPRGGE